MVRDEIFLVIELDLYELWVLLVDCAHQAIFVLDFNYKWLNSIFNLCSNLFQLIILGQIWIHSLSNFILFERRNKKLIDSWHPNVDINNILKIKCAKNSQIIDTSLMALFCYDFEDYNNSFH